jgi:quinohemoprotein ethanol dehydrogenase
MSSRLIALIAVGTLVVAGAVVAVVGARSGPHSGGDWPLFGKTADNTRFSPADRIRASTVGGLEVAWRRGPGAAAAPGRATHPVVVGRRMYVTTPADQVLALDAATGRLIWRNDAGPSRRGPRMPLTADRAVAVADGRVYALTLDCRLLALDETTGRRLWRTRVADAGRCTAAPTVWDGIAFAAGAHGEDGARGFVAAFDGETGEEEWRRRTSGVWAPPTIDTTRGILYAGTGAPPSGGPPGPRRSGGSSAGLLALRARTGEVDWLHHEPWDHGAGSAVVIFETKVNGRRVRAVGQAGLGGRFLALSARSGRPLYRPVPTPEDRARRCPGVPAGSSAAPVALSPRSGTAYVSGPAGARPAGAFAAIDLERGRVRWRHCVGAPMLGGAAATAGGLVFAGDARGTLYAFDAGDGRIAWRRRFDGGFASAPIVYTIDGVEYLAVVSGASGAGGSGAGRLSVLRPAPRAP